MTFPAAGSATPAPVSAPPAPAPAAPSAPAPAAAPTPQNQFGSALRREMESRLTGKPSSSNSSGPAPLPSGLVAGAAPAASASPSPATNPPASAIPPSVTPGAAEDPNKKPETPAPVEPSKNPLPASIRLEKFGKEFSMPEIEAAIEGYQYYHPKVLQIQENLKALEAGKAELEAGKAEIQQLRSGPEMMFLEFMDKSPEFKASVVKLCQEFNPNLVTDFQAKEGASTNAALADLQKRFDAQAAELKALKDGSVAREQQEWEQYERSVHQGLDQVVQGEVTKLRGEGIEITQDDLTNIARAAGALVKAKQLPFTVEALSRFFNTHIGNLAGRFRSVRTSATAQQAHEKAQLPPPPPTGGGAPVLSPPSPTNSKEFAQRLAEGLSLSLRRT